MTKIYIRLIEVRNRFTHDQLTVFRYELHCVSAHMQGLKLMCYFIEEY